MNTYGYTFKQRFFYRLKRFFLKTLIFSLIVIGGTVYFFKSDLGNNVQLIHDFKNKTNEQITSIYDNQSTEFTNSVRKDLGLAPIVKPNVNNTVKNTTVNDTAVDTTTAQEKPTITNEKKGKSVEPIIEKPVTNIVNETPAIPTEVVNHSDFTVYKIPFYYDHSNAPKGVTKEEALTILKKASQQWTDACGITFEYKGDKLADYVNNKNVIGGKTGIIKWETQMEDSSIGEAHVGNYQGPAPGFVLALFSDFFAHNKADLVNTITHEMGHVIGLDHSANKNSVMFPTERPSAQLQESDKAMCRYFRYRWSGMNQNQAQDKAGVLSNSMDDD